MPSPSKLVRFDLDDTIIERHATNEPDIDEAEERLYTTPSPTHSQSTASSSSGPRTPDGNACAALKDVPAADDDNTLDPLLHSALSMKGSFFWDMTRNPNDLEDLLNHFDDPVGVDGLSKEPLARLELAIHGLYHWRINILPSKETFCTVHDAFSCIYNDLSKFVTKAEAERHDKSTQKRTFQAREIRCRDLGLELHLEPLRRIDYLCGARRFLGLSSCGTPGHFRLHVGMLSSAD